MADRMIPRRFLLLWSLAGIAVAGLVLWGFAAHRTRAAVQSLGALDLEVSYATETDISESGINHHDLGDTSPVAHKHYFDAETLSGRLSTFVRNPRLISFWDSPIAVEQGIFPSLTLRDSKLRSLSNLPTLRLVSLGGCPVDNAALALGLSRLERLEYLEVWRSGADDRILEAVSGAERLIWVNARGNPITDKGLIALSRCRRLRTLILSETQITDESLRVLENMPHLERLELSETAVSDRVIDHLAALPKLHRLCLYKAKVTRAILPKLATMPNLKKVEIGGTSITDDEINEFQKLVPNVWVQGNWYSL